MNRVLLISNMYPGPGAPSNGIFVKRCEQSLEAHGWTVQRAVLVGRHRRTARPFAYLKFCGAVCRQVLRRKYHLVYAHYMLHSLLPIATVLSAVKTPLVVHAHGTDLFSEAPQSRLIRRLTRGVVDAADLLIVPSEWFGERVLERYPGARVFVSPSGGVDEDVFFPKGRVSESDEGFHIGFVSRLIQSKGWRVLLRAIELLRARNATLNFRVSFIGPREEMDEFIAARRDAKLDAVVSHRGEFEGKALAEWYRSFSVLVFPSLLPESLGLVGLESMSCGTPVVASRIGGIGSYLRDGVNGYCFEPGNAVQLADRLETLIRSSDFQRESFRRSCIDTASAYRSTEVGRKLSARLQSLVVDRIF